MRQLRAEIGAVAKADGYEELAFMGFIVIIIIFLNSFWTV